MDDPKTNGNIPTNSYGQCVACGLLPVECRCDWTGFCVEHQISYFDCRAGNLMCRPPKKSSVAAPTALEPAPQTSSPEQFEPEEPGDTNGGPTEPTPSASTPESPISVPSIEEPWESRYRPDEVFRFEGKLYRGQGSLKNGTWTYTCLNRKSGKTKRSGRSYSHREEMLNQIMEECGPVTEVADDGTPYERWAHEPLVTRPGRPRHADTPEPMKETARPAPRAAKPNEPRNAVAKPTPLFPSADKVPAELRPLKRWLGFRYKWNGHKWNKPPHSPVTGEAIGANAKWAEHWLTFDEALTVKVTNLGVSLGNFYTSANICFHLLLIIVR